MGGSDPTAEVEAMRDREKGMTSIFEIMEKEQKRKKNGNAEDSEDDEETKEAQKREAEQRQSGRGMVWVGTPGRVLDLMERVYELHLKKLEIFVMVSNHSFSEGPDLSISHIFLLVFSIFLPFPFFSFLSLLSMVRIPCHSFAVLSDSIVLTWLLFVLFSCSSSSCHTVLLRYSCLPLVFSSHCSITG